jgi:hypothetical protein
MPLHLEPLELSDELKSYRSVLLVSCPVCPPASLAGDNNSPFIEFFKHGIKTPAYEKLLDELRESLESKGIRTGVFTSYLPCPTTCLWTAGQRKRLLKRARDYDAAVVMGCASAQCTVEETLKDADCDAILGMRLVGITNARLKFGFPLNIELDSPMRVGANEQVGHATQAAGH